MVIQKIRYFFISQKVYTLLTTLHLKKYPIDLHKVIDSLHVMGLDIRLDTYSSYANFKKTSTEYIAKNILKSDYGATAYIPEANLYIIFVNDTNQTEGRMNWTISHEIGHIVLEHYKIMAPLLMQRRGISDEQYEILEKEADRFTQDFICNPLILSKCNLLNAQEIKHMCNISDEASENRLKNIHNLKSKKRFINRWDALILQTFKDFIYAKKCSVCNYYFIHPQAKYCPICGNDNLKRRKDTNMEYINEYNLDKNGKVIDECTHCENEDLPSDGVFCKICGTPVVNKCTNQSCNKAGDGKSRYCIYCGNETTFFKHNMLHSWDYRDSSSTHQNFDEEDDLPF